MDHLEPTWVYRLYGPAGDLLYVGQTQHPMKRLESHRYNIKGWCGSEHFTLTEYPSRVEAMQAEREAIWAERPAHNEDRYLSKKPASWRGMPRRTQVRNEIVRRCREGLLDPESALAQVRQVWPIWGVTASRRALGIHAG